MKNPGPVIAEVATYESLDGLAMLLEGEQPVGAFAAVFINGLHMGCMFALDHPTEARRFLDLMNTEAKMDQFAEEDKLTIGKLTEAFEEDDDAERQA